VSSPKIHCLLAISREQHVRHVALSRNFVLLLSNDTEEDSREVIA
jgi:hypothetical protein